MRARLAVGGVTAAALVAVAALWPTPTRSAAPPAPAASPPARVAPPAATTVQTRAPAPAPASIPRAPGAVALSAPWGGEPGRVGRRVDSEASPEGPMSFVVDRQGRAIVLDQVNARVQVFDPQGEPRVVPLPADTFQDVALDGRGRVVALDRLGAKSVAFVEPSGAVASEVAIEGTGIAEAGLVTALEQRDDGTWLEVQHQHWVRVADADGRPDATRPRVEGRLTADGKHVLRASKSGASAVWVVTKSGDETPRPLVRVQFDLPVAFITALEPLPDGRIVLGVHLMREADAPPFAVVEEREEVVILGFAGDELSRIALPASTGPEESLRRLRVGADGAIYHLSFDDGGATLRRLRP